MSYLTRTIRNLFKVGLRDAAHQMHNIGDTKAGTLIGIDKFGNKFFENNEELPLRNRWVDYKEHDFDASHIEPHWHAWISYLVDTPPDKDPITAVVAKRPWAAPDHRPTYTMTRGAYKPYNTAVPKTKSWDPVAASRA